MKVLKQEEVLESWSQLIEDGKGKSEEVFSLTKKLLSETGVPNVEQEMRDIAPGYVRGILGGKRKFLYIKHTKNPHLKPYHLYLNARDYGKYLDVSWYLVGQLTKWQKIWGIALRIPILNFLVFPFYLLVRFVITGKAKVGFLDLDLFDRQDLRSYTTVVHNCCLEAVSQIVKNLGQSPDCIERRTRGFLGISA